MEIHRRGQNGWAIKSFTIAQSGTTSDVVDLEGYSTFVLHVPTVDSTPSLTVDVCPDGEASSAVDLQSDASTEAVNIALGAGGYALTSTALANLGPARFVVFVLSAAQAAARTFYLEMKA